MIIDFLLDAIEAVFDFVVGLFPVTDFNPVQTFSDMLGVLGDLDYFLPIHELAGLVIAFLLLGAPFLVVTLAIWVLALIRGAGATG